MNRAKRMTRRHWLKAAASAAVVSGLLPRAARARVAPSDRIGLGFIGMGTMARGHLGWFLGQSDVAVRAVCDVDHKRREHAKTQVESRYAKDLKSGAYRGCGAYNDFRELLARDDIDGVLIATPDHWHAIPAIEACQEGKDIYCEKPLTLTIHEAKTLVDVVRKHDRVFQTGSQQRSDSEFRIACEYVRSGRIGKIKRVEVNVGGPSRWCDLPEEPAEDGLDWDRWLGPAPLRPYHSVLSPRGVHDHFPNWRSYREYSGGGMTDWGAHHFDIAQWGLGMDESGPVEVLPPDDPKAETGVRFRYADGVEVIHGPGGGVHFVGETGEITVNRGKLESTPGTILKEPLGSGDTHLYESPGHQRDWLNCMRSRKRPICDVEIGARSVTVCHLGNLAYWNRRSMRWDPKSWSFVDDAEANTWRDRERRGPWHLPKV
ncbi:MAG: Gfo/Idh/MocA family oxidoreductase [Planctomycetes bacterium]|nr:Gfo/Idh/MocA family oxidoreductase [Planctomycetota bacterium]